MLGYFFYTNFSRIRNNPFNRLVLLIVIKEIDKLIFNISYLNLSYLNIIKYGRPGTNKDIKQQSFNFTFFFFKISFLNKIFFTFFKLNKKIKFWKGLLFSFFISINSFFLMKSPLIPNISIIVDKHSINNLLVPTFFINLKFNKNPSFFFKYYFFTFFFKLFLSTKYPLYVPKSWIFFDFYFFFFFKLVTYDFNKNHRFKNYLIS